MFPSNYLPPIPRQGLPGHSFVYFSPLSAPLPLVLSLPLPPVRFSNKHASYVWNASIVLADMIANEEIEVEGKRVLELGYGAGLPGVVTAHKGAELVVLSDFDNARMLEDLRDTVDEAVAQRYRSRICIAGHSFGEPTKSLVDLSPTYDTILVADCIWDCSLHEPLLDTLLSLLSASPSAVVHFTCGFHTGRAVVADFVDLARRRGIVAMASQSPKEISVEGEVRMWKAPEGAARKGGLKDGREKQEERNRWTFVACFELVKNGV
ncbi:hypothetical protein JCM16303_007332 [Sporobolomyces ruberrimus]